MLLSFVTGLPSWYITKTSNLERLLVCAQLYMQLVRKQKSAIHPNWVNDTVKTLITAFSPRLNSDTNIVIIADCFAIVNLFAKERMYANTGYRLYRSLYEINPSSSEPGRAKFFTSP